jgi:hypothetical protein
MADIRSDRLAFRNVTVRMRILNAIRSDGRCYSCGNLRDVLRPSAPTAIEMVLKQVLSPKDVMHVPDGPGDS